MTATEALRKEVRKYINKADDKSLRMVKAILEIEQEEDKDVDESSLEPENWDDLPEELQLMIDQGIKDGEDGNVMSYEQVKEKYSEWFRK